MNHLSKAFYSPETIAFQPTIFRDALIALFAQYRDSPATDIRVELEQSLSDAVKKYTNINIDFQIGNYQMSVEVPQIDRNSPLLEGYGFGDVVTGKRTISDIRKGKTTQVVGLIDPNGSYVNGYLAELPPVRLYLNQYMIYSGTPKKGELSSLAFTNEELAAIVLHEVGHVFGFMAFLIRFRTDNQILAATARELEGSVDNGKRELIIKEAGDALGIKAIDAQDLSHKNNSTVYTVIITNMVRQNRSQTGSGYDINSFEMLADKFATRHGAGLALVTGLDKLSKGTIARRGYGSYYFYEFVKIAMGLLGIFMAGTGALGLGIYLVSITSLLLLADSHNEWYDKTGYRFKRIRNDLMELLKNPNTSKLESARIRADIDQIEEVNEKYKDHTQFIGLVYDYLIPSGISKRKDIEFQQQLESMSATKLFYYANQLKNK